MATGVAVFLAFAALAMFGAAPAMAGAFIDVPRSGEPQPYTNTSWEQKCTFGSIGYVMVRVRGVLDVRAAGSYITIKGIQLFNYTTHTVTVTDEYIDAGLDPGFDDYVQGHEYNSADVNYYLTPNGGKHDPTWFDTGAVSDSYYWQYHNSVKGWWDNAGTTVPQISPYYRARLLISGLSGSYGCQIKVNPTNHL